MKSWDETYVDNAFINSWFAVSMVAEVVDTGSPMDMRMNSRDRK